MSRPPRSTRAKKEGPFRVEYYNTRVREDIEDWPVDVLARCVAEGFCVGEAFSQRSS